MDDKALLIAFIMRAVPLNPSLIFACKDTDRLQKSEIVRVNDPLLAANLKYVFFCGSGERKICPSKYVPQFLKNSCFM